MLLARCRRPPCRDAGRRVARAARTRQVAHADGQGITIYVYLRPGASAPGIIFVITFDESYSVVVESNKNSLSFVCRTNLCHVHVD